MHFLKIICIFLVCMVISIECEMKLQKFCGHNLVKELLRVCQGRDFNTYDKRSSLPSYDEINDLENDSLSPFNANFDDPIFMNKGSLMRNWRSLRAVYLTRECCDKQCTISTLLSYC
ncbi:ins.2 family protein [Megaselia abdita]